MLLSVQCPTLSAFVPPPLVGHAPLARNKVSLFSRRLTAFGVEDRCGSLGEDGQPLGLAFLLIFRSFSQSPAPQSAWHQGLSVFRGSALSSASNSPCDVCTDTPEVGRRLAVSLVPPLILTLPPDLSRCGLR